MKLRATNVFYRMYNCNKRYIVHRGGTRSSKTFSIAQLIALWLYTGYIENGGKYYEKGILSVVRKNSTTLKATAQRDIEKAIDELGIRHLIDINKSERTYKYNGRMVELFGADHEQKLRGGSRDILYCNEANELGWDAEFFQLMIRTNDKIIIDFNPDDEDVWINKELEEKRSQEVGDVEVIVSTYRDNPFLPITLIKEIERLEHTNPGYYRVYGLGQYGKLEGLIFADFEIVHNLPDDAELVCYGLDFGFTNDPTVLVGLYRFDGKLIAHQFIYERGLTNKAISDKMIALGISKDVEIRADSAEPKSIEELSQLGWNIKPVKKGADSVMYGINILQGFKLGITAGSVEGIKEFKKYVWLVDKNGKPINKPVDIDNHFIDALRYGAMMSLGSSGELSIFIG